MIYDKTCGNVRMSVVEAEGETRAHINVEADTAGLTLEDLRDLRYLIDRALAAHEHAPVGATVVTDQHAGYVGLQAGGYEHIRINHSVGEFVRDMAHTNGIESFWALLKRGHYGIYHYMSPKHLHRYVNEFAFRHNTAQAGTMRFIEMTAARMLGKRLTYKALINA